MYFVHITQKMYSVFEEFLWKTQRRTWKLREADFPSETREIRYVPAGREGGSRIDSNDCETVICPANTRWPVSEKIDQEQG
jgi:hypothetical protein